jgi:hypothetical protein
MADNGIRYFNRLTGAYQDERPEEDGYNSGEDRADTIRRIARHMELSFGRRAMPASGFAMGLLRLANHDAYHSVTDLMADIDTTAQMAHNIVSANAEALGTFAKYVQDVSRPMIVKLVRCRLSIIKVLDGPSPRLPLLSEIEFKAAASAVGRNPLQLTFASDLCTFCELEATEMLNIVSTYLHGGISRFSGIQLVLIACYVFTFLSNTDWTETLDLPTLKEAEDSFTSHAGQDKFTKMEFSPDGQIDFIFSSNYVKDCCDKDESCEHGMNKADLVAYLKRVVVPNASLA